MINNNSYMKKTRHYKLQCIKVNVNTQVVKPIKSNVVSKLNSVDFMVGRCN